MTISAELEAKILRYFPVEKWRVGTIALQLGIHHGTVDRVLSQAGLPKLARPHRASLLDPYRPFVRAILEQYPTLTASRLYAMVRERGYAGGQDHFRHLMLHYRPRAKPEAYLRLKTLPGEQAHVDWGHFGKLTGGRAERPLMGAPLAGDEPGEGGKAKAFAGSGKRHPHQNLAAARFLRFGIQLRNEAKPGVRAGGGPTTKRSQSVMRFHRNRVPRISRGRSEIGHLCSNWPAW